MMIGEAILYGVMGLAATCGGVGVYAAIQDERERQQVAQIEAANNPAIMPISGVPAEPIPWGKVETQLPQTMQYGDDGGVSLLPKLSAEQVQECIRYQLKPEIYAMAIDGLPPDMIPHPSELVTWDVPTPPQTDEGTRLGTGTPTRETHESIERMGVSADFRNLSDDLSGDISETLPKVSAELSEREALQLEREIKAFAPYPIDATDSDSLFAVESALQLEKSKAWMCKELFGGIKPGGNKEYQEFQKLVEKAS